MSLETTFEERLEAVKTKVNKLIDFCALKQKKLFEFYDEAGDEMKYSYSEHRKKNYDFWAGEEAFDFLFKEIAKLNDNNGITRPWVKLN